MPVLLLDALRDVRFVVGPIPPWVSAGTCSVPMVGEEWAGGYSFTQLAMLRAEWLYRYARDSNLVNWPLFPRCLWIPSVKAF